MTMQTSRARKPFAAGWLSKLAHHFGGTFDGLPAREKILPRIGTGQPFLVVAQIEIRRD
jgi:hypothetical protein